MVLGHQSRKNHNKVKDILPHRKVPGHPSGAFFSLKGVKGPPLWSLGGQTPRVVREPWRRGVPSGGRNARRWIAPQGKRDLGSWGAWGYPPNKEAKAQFSLKSSNYHLGKDSHHTSVFRSNPKPSKWQKTLIKMVVYKFPHKTANFSVKKCSFP